MFKKILGSKWILIGTATALAAVVVLVIVLSLPSGPDADHASDTAAAPNGQLETGPDTANNPETDPGNGAAGDNGASTGQTDPGTAGDNATSPDGQDAGAADSNEAAASGQGETGTTDAYPTQPPTPVNPNPVKSTVKAPAGQTELTIELRVNESKPYAGIEFALTISDEDALDFASFEPGQDGAFAAPFMTDEGKHYFGYYAGSNAFGAGDKLAGTLTFTGFKGDQPLTVTVVHMKVIRLDDDNKAVTTDKGTPAYVFTIARETTG